MKKGQKVARHGERGAYAEVDTIYHAHSSQLTPTVLVKKQAHYLQAPAQSSWSNGSGPLGAPPIGLSTNEQVLLARVDPLLQQLVQRCVIVVLRAKGGAPLP